MARANSAASPSSGVMSLKMIPGRGKSGTSRTTRRSSVSRSGAVAMIYALAAENAEWLRQLVHRGPLAILHRVDGCALRSAPNSGQQAGQIFVRARGGDLDRAVGEVSNPAPNPPAASLLPDEPAEADSLNLPDHDPMRGGHAHLWEANLFGAPLHATVHRSRMAAAGHVAHPCVPTRGTNRTGATSTRSRSAPRRVSTVST